MYPACCEAERRAELYHSPWLLGRFMDQTLSFAPLPQPVFIPIPSKLNEETGVKLRTLLVGVQAVSPVLCLRVLVVMPMGSSPWPVSWSPTFLQASLCLWRCVSHWLQCGYATCTARILGRPNFPIFGAVQDLSRSKLFCIEKIPFINYLWKALSNCTFSH